MITSPASKHTQKMGDSPRDPSHAFQGRMGKASFPGAGTAQRLLPGKLHSWITSCINRHAGGEASGVRGREETRSAGVLPTVKWKKHRHTFYSVPKEVRKPNSGQRKLCLPPSTSNKTQGSALLGCCHSVVSPEANSGLIWLFWYQLDCQHKQ